MHPFTKHLAYTGDKTRFPWPDAKEQTPVEPVALKGRCDRQNKLDKSGPNPAENSVETCAKRVESTTGAAKTGHWLPLSPTKRRVWCRASGRCWHREWHCQNRSGYSSILRPVSQPQWAAIDSP